MRVYHLLLALAKFELMEELQARHRKEQRDLVGRTTQKKKAATKKTRKGINDECEQLERELKERQNQEFAAFNGEAEEGDEAPAESGITSAEPTQTASDDVNRISDSLKDTSISEPSAPLTNGTLDPTSPSSQRKPNRQKARLARRAQEQEEAAAEAEKEAANMPNRREMEREKMSVEFRTRGLREQEIRADGHCLYSAVADQLKELGLGLKPKITAKVIAAAEDGDQDTDEQALPSYKVTRRAAADYISRHPDDFAPFLEEPLDVYVKKIRDTGEWGGQLELMALAKSYGVDINVLQGEGRVEKIEGTDGEEEEEKRKGMWLAYYRHGFGLGEHYNSLRKEE
ncbi:cysteine proteinase [Aulographum hederae CBS 113979]|uniref:Cysteine proteinase n=1 Tax=Aulographum hederae CBS 113979 TaxID=1176131 RepID=A0A6G1GP66_9PEZI|nr:cysteine proteinase [Aulographum hederae CBS 113979]